MKWNSLKFPWLHIHFFFTLGTLFYRVCACISKFYTCKALEKQRSHYFRWHKISHYNVHICTLYMHLGNKRQSLDFTVQI